MTVVGLEGTSSAIAATRGSVPPQSVVHPIRLNEKLNASKVLSVRETGQNSRRRKQRLDLIHRRVVPSRADEPAEAALNRIVRLTLCLRHIEPVQPGIRVSGDLVEVGARQLDLDQDAVGGLPVREAQQNDETGERKGVLSTFGTGIASPPDEAPPAPLRLA